MIISDENEKLIGDAIDKLSEVLDSDAYMDMVNNLDTPPEKRKTLNQCWSQRNRLMRILLKIYAKDIEEKNDDFKKLISQMKGVRQEAEEAADGLKKIADRIESAVKMAKAVDAAIKIAAALAAA